MDNMGFIAAFWMGVALLASLISIQLGISVALIEILVGIIVGNIHLGQYHDILRTTEWTNLLGDTADRVSDHVHCSVLIVKN